jgi:tRNA modification GTPase
MVRKETIAAIATGMSNAGIGIVRISGDSAFQVIDRIYKGKELLSEAETHTIHYGYIVEENRTVDEVLVSIMRAPRTFTGEDTVEINCHGGVYVVKRVLETVLRNGARPAEPGEFTKRAFLNGKIDLSQAEAVGDLISSRNEYALQSSISQLKGSIKNKIENIRKKIIYHTAYIESALDDPEHISLDGYGDTLKEVLDEIVPELKEMIDSYENGRILKEGIQTVILGKPNAGKSSLLNVLSGRERAIVTDIAGTTRDILEEQIQIHGLNLNVIDTAGIRDTDDVIERIGVDRAMKYARQADLLIYVVDSSRELDENDREIAKIIQKKRTIILLNKSDLHTVVTKEQLKKFISLQNKNTQYGNELNPAKSDDEVFPPMIEISAKEEKGIQKFEKQLESMFLNKNISFNEEVYITNIRQKAAMEDALCSLEKVEESIEMGMPEDFYTIDLMDAYEALGSITGETIGEDLVNEIFSKFCMGK